jgi:flagellar motor switch protein FliN
MNRDSNDAVAPTLIQFSELSERQEAANGVVLANFDVVRNVQVKLSVVAGRGSIPVGELLSLRQGQVVKLESLLDTPMEVLLDGNVIARGDLVAVGDHFGVRIGELAAPRR